MSVHSPTAAVAAHRRIRSKVFVKDVDVSGRTVLLRAEFNVPTGDGPDAPILDDRRIRATLPTIRWLRNHGARVVVIAHRGRPGGSPNPELSLEPMVTRLGELLEEDVPLIPHGLGDDARHRVGSMDDGGLAVLENIRFYPGETTNSVELAQSLASLGDVYINDAFGAAHRAHASTSALAELMPVSAAGLLMRKELDTLGHALEEPEHPFVAVIGGAKVKTKITVLRALARKVDSLLVGGGMAYTFFRAMGLETGKSLVDETQLHRAREILASAEWHETAELILPVDCVASYQGDDTGTCIVGVKEIPPDLDCQDAGPRTRQRFASIVRQAHTVIWNGPMGRSEYAPFAEGTRAMARAIAECDGCTIVGGGDSAAAILREGLEDQVSLLSTGGGALLRLLEGRPLPAVSALTDA